MFVLLANLYTSGLLSARSKRSPRVWRMWRCNKLMCMCVCGCVSRCLWVWGCVGGVWVGRYVDVCGWVGGCDVCVCVGVFMCLCCLYVYVVCLCYVVCLFVCVGVRVCVLNNVCVWMGEQKGLDRFHLLSNCILKRIGNSENLSHSLFSALPVDFAAVSSFYKPGCVVVHMD